MINVPMPTASRRARAVLMGDAAGGKTVVPPDRPPTLPSLRSIVNQTERRPAARRPSAEDILVEALRPIALSGGSGRAAGTRSLPSAWHPFTRYEAYAATEILRRWHPAGPDRSDIASSAAYALATAIGRRHACNPWDLARAANVAVVWGHPAGCTARLDPGLRGVTGHDPLFVAIINRDCSESEAAAVLSHELAHALLGHGDRTDTAQKEREAQAWSFGFFYSGL